MSLRAGLDFGLSNLDGVLLEDGRLVHSWRQPAGVPASEAGLLAALAAGGVEPASLDLIATTGGRHRDLPPVAAGVPVRPVGEAQSIGRGGLALAGLPAALVVSAGSGTAMVAARDGAFRHVTGSAVGGGTLLGLAWLLLGTTDPLEVGRLAALGDTSAVDSTLADAIGGGVGSLPPTATAVNFGRVARLEALPRPQDAAAGLVTLVSQVIAVIALNAARAEGLGRVVVVGHLPDLEPIRAALERVWGFYGVTPGPLIPENGGAATALGAALEEEAAP